MMIIRRKIFRSFRRITALGLVVKNIYSIENPFRNRTCGKEHRPFTYEGGK